MFRNVTSTSEGEYKCTEYIDRYPEPSGVSLQVLLSLTVKTSHNITNSETGVLLACRAVVLSVKSFD